MDVEQRFKNTLQQPSALTSIALTLTKSSKPFEIEIESSWRAEWVCHDLCAWLFPRSFETFDWMLLSLNLSGSELHNCVLQRLAIVQLPSGVSSLLFQVWMV